MQAYHHTVEIHCESKNSTLDFCPSLHKLEYLAVYGRASMAAFRQFSTHGQKFDPESLYELM